MANPNRASGFRPMGTLGGAPWNARVRRYTAADRSADTTQNHGDIYVGDPLKISSGKVLPANSGDQVIGVCVAVGVNASVNDNGIGPYNPDGLSTRYGPYGTATGVEVWVCLAEDTTFEIQSASDLDLAVGSAADTNVAASTTHGSRTNGLSSAQLTTDSNHDVKVVDIPKYPDNDSTLTNTRYVVMFTNVEMAQP